MGRCRLFIHRVSNMRRGRTIARERSQLCFLRGSPSINKGLGIQASFFTLRGEFLCEDFLVARFLAHRYTEGEPNSNFRTPKEPENKKPLKSKTQTKLNHFNSISIFPCQTLISNHHHGYSISLLSGGGRQSSHGSVRHTQSR